ncbi:hypothetical protein MRX96_056913 [Rhipicephalus microplus]
MVFCSDKACEEAPFDVEEASVEGISLSVMLSQPPTETLIDIQESWQVFKETGSTDSSLSLEDNASCDSSLVEESEEVPKVTEALSGAEMLATWEEVKTEDNTLVTEESSTVNVQGDSDATANCSSSTESQGQPDANTTAEEEMKEASNKFTGTPRPT